MKNKCELCKKESKEDLYHFCVRDRDYSMEYTKFKICDQCSQEIELYLEDNNKLYPDGKKVQCELCGDMMKDFCILNVMEKEKDKYTHFEICDRCVAETHQQFKEMGRNK